MWLLQRFNTHTHTQYTYMLWVSKCVSFYVRFVLLCLLYVRTSQPASTWMNENVAEPFLDLLLFSNYWNKFTQKVGTLKVNKSNQIKSLNKKNKNCCETYKNVFTNLWTVGSPAECQARKKEILDWSLLADWLTAYYRANQLLSTKINETKKTKWYTRKPLLNEIISF